jgi:hypothetical protein
MTTPAKPNAGVQIYTWVGTALFPGSDGHAENRS